MKRQITFLCGIVAATLIVSARPAHAVFNVTGGNVGAVAAVDLTTGVGDDDAQTDLIGLAIGFGLPQTALASLPGNAASAKAVASNVGNVLQGQIAVGTSVGAINFSNAYGQVVIAFNVASSGSYRLDTFMVDGLVEDSTIVLYDTTLATSVVAHTGAVPGGGNFVGAGAFSQNVNLLSTSTYEIHAITFLTTTNAATISGEAIQFDLYCVPEPSQYAMLGLAGVFAAAGRYGWKRFWV